MAADEDGVDAETNQPVDVLAHGPRKPEKNCSRKDRYSQDCRTTDRRYKQGADDEHDIFHTVSLLRQKLWSYR